MAQRAQGRRRESAGATATCPDIHAQRHHKASNGASPEAIESIVPGSLWKLPPMPGPIQGSPPLGKTCPVTARDRLFRAGVWSGYLDPRREKRHTNPSVPLFLEPARTDNDGVGMPVWKVLAGAYRRTGPAPPAEAGVEGGQSSSDFQHWVRGVFDSRKSWSEPDACREPLWRCEPLSARLVQRAKPRSSMKQAGLAPILWRAFGSYAASLSN